jgi:hypothetical protein
MSYMQPSCFMCGCLVETLMSACASADSRNSNDQVSRRRQLGAPCYANAPMTRDLSRRSARRAKERALQHTSHGRTSSSKQACLARQCRRGRLVNQLISVRTRRCLIIRKSTWSLESPMSLSRAYSVPLSSVGRRAIELRTLVRNSPPRAWRILSRARSAGTELSSLEHSA